MTIQNFQSGDLGLHLNDTATTPETSRTIVGDLAPVDFNLAEAGVQASGDELGNVIVDPNQPQANRVDTLYDSVGNDDIRAYGGNDRIEAFRGGNDKLHAGAEVTLEAALAAQASFALIQEGATLDADTPGSISLAYQGAEQSATSNAWGVNLKDTGELARTYNGDQRAKLIGIAINLEVTPDKPGYNTYNWGATTWATDGVGDGHNRHLTAKHRSVPCRQRIRHPKLSHRSFLLQVDQMQVGVNH